MQKIIFVDTETVPIYENFEECKEKDPILATLWEKKAKNSTKDIGWESAGLYPEFNKIVAISFGAFDGKIIRIKSFVGSDERALIVEFNQALTIFINSGYHSLCAFNGENFDFPCLSKKYVKYQIPIPSILSTLFKKPWETSLIDPFKLWKFNSYNEQNANLELICHMLGVPSPKIEISGEDVKEAFFKEGEMGLVKIGQYCNRDVLALMRFYGKLMYMPNILEIPVENIENLKIVKDGA